MKKHLLSIISILLIIILIFCSCASNNNVDENKKFENTCEEINELLLTESTLDLHFCLSDTISYDSKNSDVSLGHIYYDKSNDMTSPYKSITDMLDSINPKLLTTSNAYTYDVIYRYSQNQLQLIEYPYSYDPLSAYSGEQVQLPLLLAEFPFNGSNDVEIYFKLLYDLPRYFEEIIEFEKERVNNGEFMSENAYKTLIDFCKNFSSGTNSQHFLSTSFEKKLSSLCLDEALYNSYIQEHLKILESKVFPAYEKLARDIEELAANAIFSNNGLCHSKNGRDYYTILLKSLTGDIRNPDDIGNELLINLTSLSDRLNSCLKENTQLMTSLLNENFDIVINSDEILKVSEKYLDVLYDLSCDSFDNKHKKLVYVEQIEDSLSNYFSSAYFFLPPVDDFSHPTIYINPNTEFTSFDLLTTLAHEGYPGHLMQTQMQKNNLSSRLFSCLGYCEGWASYCELYTYPHAVRYLKLGDENDYENTAYCLKLYRELTLCLYALLDYNIHYNYWSVDDAAIFLSSYGINDKTQLTNIYNYIVNEPANYMTYYVGYINVVKLKEKYIAQGHTEDEFHKAFLNCNEAPFDIVEKYLLKA